MSTTETVDLDTGEVKTVASEQNLPAAVPPRSQREIIAGVTENKPKPRRARSDDLKTVSEITTAVCKITAEVGVIPKRGHNRFHNYKYAIFADVLAKLTPLLASNGIAIWQSELERSMFDDGRVLSVQYQFVISHVSGEIWIDVPKKTGVCRCRDSKGGWDDKSFNKCATSARKYFLLELFQIVTGEEEADEQEISYPPQDVEPPRRPTATPVARPAAADAAGSRSPAAGGAPHQRTAQAGAPLSQDGVPADDDAEPQSEELQAEYNRLNAASLDGKTASERMDKLRAVWNAAPSHVRLALETAKENIFKLQAKTGEVQF